MELVFCNDDLQQKSLFVDSGFNFLKLFKKLRGLICPHKSTYCYSNEENNRHELTTKID